MGDPDRIPEDELATLPLFPLNVVLFPGMALPLHIFEERYKAMTGDCIEHKKPFGVVLIHQGQEVGEPAQPFNVGATARIIHSERLPGGRLNILTMGEQRFETAEVTQQRPHLAGLVKYLQEHPGDVPQETITEATDGYATFRRSLSALSGGWTSQIEMPQDPVPLSYSIASALDLPRHVSQELLECPTAGQRLEKLLPLLKRSNEALAQEVAKRNPYQGPRLN